MTTSPVAAFTSGGPPRKIVPWSWTMTVSSLIAGTYAPPAVHEPMTAASCGMPARGQVRLVVEDAAEVLAVGEHLVLQRQERAAGVDEVDAGQPVLQRDLLRAQVLLHRDRVVGAALDGGVVGDDHALAPADPADAGDDAGARARRRRTCRRRPAGRARGTASPGRAAGRRGRAPAACRGRRAARGPRREPPRRTSASRSRSSATRSRSPGLSLTRNMLTIVNLRV